MSRIPPPTLDDLRVELVDWKKCREQYLFMGWRTRWIDSVISELEFKIREVERVRDTSTAG